MEFFHFSRSTAKGKGWKGVSITTLIAGKTALLWAVFICVFNEFWHLSALNLYCLHPKSTCSGGPLGPNCPWQLNDHFHRLPVNEFSPCSTLKERRSNLLSCLFVLKCRNPAHVTDSRTHTWYTSSKVGSCVSSFKCPFKGVSIYCTVFPHHESHMLTPCFLLHLSGPQSELKLVDVVGCLGWVIAEISWWFPVSLGSSRVVPTLVILKNGSLAILRCWTFFWMVKSVTLSDLKKRLGIERSRLEWRGGDFFGWICWVWPL